MRFFSSAMHSESSPPKPKRFSPSLESFAKERRRGLQRVFENYQERHPELVGLTLYGSVIRTRSVEDAIRLRDEARKAKHRPDSDIDGFFFVDVEEVKRWIGDPDIVEFEHTEGGITNAHFRSDIRKHYLRTLREAVQKELPDLTDDQVYSLYVVPISWEIVETLLRKWHETIQGRERFQPNREARINTYLAPQIYEMFFLAVGRGLDKYRRYVIDFLSELGTEGEDMWLELITLVELMEYVGELDSARHYPRTLAEARAVYGRGSNQYG